MTPSAHIIGLGRSGIAAARLLRREGWSVSISDRNHTSGLVQLQQELGSEGIQVLLDCSFDLTTLKVRLSQTPDLVVVSPGVPWDLSGLVEARAQGIETIGEIELAWRHLRDYPWVGITGTNGKTTTTALVAAIFQAAGLNAPACGNIGYSACDLALEGKSVDWVVAELSSYQLESTRTLAPQIGLWTTFTPDHLSRHGTIENYRDIKATLLYQSDQQILNGDDPYLREFGVERWPDAWWTSIHGKTALPGNPAQGVYLENGWIKIQDEPLLPLATWPMPGLHNCQNLLMAIAAAHLAGLEPTAMVQGITTFPGVPHRLETIITWQGARFINDSKATNYDAAETGLAAVEGPVILIAGGEPKAGDDSRWIAAIQAKVAAVLLIGEAAPAFARRLQEVGYRDYEIVETLEAAIPRAAELVQASSVPSVLLSPACASFDQYLNFEQRGDHFRQLCQDLLTLS
jgi:UDP-N-acetylmuramoylalanine--D-glutamate ligase